MNFKIGDRVAVYGFGSFGHSRNGEPATVHFVFGNNEMIDVFLDKPSIRIRYHHKQCRLLKKKERRRIWVCMLKNTDAPYRLVADVPNDGFVEFIEVKKK